MLNMCSAKDKHGVREGFFTREEWPFPDKGILINHHFVYIYIYIYIHITHTDIYIHTHTRHYMVLSSCTCRKGAQLCRSLWTRCRIVFATRQVVFLAFSLASNRFKPSQTCQARVAPQVELAKFVWGAPCRSAACHLILISLASAHFKIFKRWHGGLTYLQVRLQIAGISNCRSSEISSCVDTV